MRVTMRQAAFLVGLLEVLCHGNSAGAQNAGSPFNLPASDGAASAIRLFPVESRVSSPGTAFSIPTAYGPRPGLPTFGLDYQHYSTLGVGPKGTTVFDVGLGNDRTGSLDLGVNVLDMDPAHLGQRGSFNLKMHRKVSPALDAALGVDNVFVWNGTDAPTQYFGALSGVVTRAGPPSLLFHRLSYTGGVGHLTVGSQNGFALSLARQAVRYWPSYYLFGSAAISLGPSVNAFAEWTGADADAGLSILAWPQVGLVLTPALSGLTGRTPFGPRFNVGFSVPLSIQSLVSTGSAPGTASILVETAATGAPVTDAIVTVSGVSTSLFRFVRTDHRGLATVQVDLPRGLPQVASVLATSPGFLPGHGAVVFHAGAADRAVVILPSPGSISGTAQDQTTGMLLPHAQILASNGTETPRVVYTDTEGRYQLNRLPAGAYTITMRREGYSDTRMSLRLDGPEKRIVNLYAAVLPGAAAAAH